MKKLVIEWRHLDVEGKTCDRCYDTGANLAAEVNRMNRMFHRKGFQIVYVETRLSGDKVSDSNRILLNGTPIERILDLNVSENYCASCSSLLGTKTYCRTVRYDGNEYEDIPAKAIRQAVYKLLGLKPASAEPRCRGNAGSSCC